MKKVLARTIYAAVCLISIVSAKAGELVTEAAVISSEPVYEHVQETIIPAHCYQRPRTVDFAEMLNWDVNCAQTVTQKVFAGYDVVYEVDGRTMRFLSQEQPGDTIELLLTLH